MDATTNQGEPTFFKTQADLRTWLQRYGAKRTSLLVGFYNKASKKPSITYPQALDEALCFGWIDGVRKRRDAESYTIRFTPRRPASNWSGVNIRRVAVLIELGLMTEAGHAAFAKRRPKKPGVYSYENRPEAFAPAYEARFKANDKAWACFLSLRPSVQRTGIFWVMSAVKEETQLKRLDELIARSEGDGWPRHFISAKSRPEAKAGPDAESEPKAKAKPKSKPRTAR